MAAFGIGGVSGGIGLSFLSDKINRFKKTPNFVAIFSGLVVITIAKSSSLLIVDCLLFVAGAAIIVTNITSNSLLQSLAGNQKRGRVISLFQMSLHCGLSLGSLITGFASTTFGIMPVLIANGILAIFFQLGILVQSKRRLTCQIKK